MFIKTIIKKYFEKGNVCVCGLRGTGKDILLGNVIARRKMSYVSNLNYTHDNNFNEFHFLDFDLGQNTYKNFLVDRLNYYEYPFEYGTDLYLSDAGVYFPSQYCNDLNKKYPYFPNYMALSRQVAHANVHYNVQNLNRVWDKIREQSDLYIMCLGCKVVFGVVFMKIRLYDKYQSACDRVKPCRIKIPIFASRDVKMNYKMHIDKYVQNYGYVADKILIFKNLSKHDTYYFEKKLKEGGFNIDI